MAIIKSLILTRNYAQRSGGGSGGGKNLLYLLSLLSVYVTLVSVRSSSKGASSSSVEEATMNLPRIDERPNYAGKNRDQLSPPAMELLLRQADVTKLQTMNATASSIVTPTMLLDLEPGRRYPELSLMDPLSVSDLPLAAHLKNLSLQTMISTTPWPNGTTMAFYEGRFRSGYRNQMMAFAMVVFTAHKQGHDQLLLSSLAQKDTYGTNRFIPFSKLWDVAHWNSHHPTLPRLVDYDPYLHDQYNVHSNPPWFRDSKTKNFLNANGTWMTNQPVRPHAFGKQHLLMAGYMTYASKGRGPHVAPGGHRNPLEILMLQGALRPNANLQHIIDSKLHEMLESTTDTGTGPGSRGDGIRRESKDYMTLHARVEPDMQRHKVCRDKKVLNLTDIFDFLERHWTTPPVSKIFLPINRQYLEQEGTHMSSSSSLSETNENAADRGDDSNGQKKKKKKVNWIAVENLKALNRARDVGLWNGTVQVYEFGAHSLQGTSYENKPSTPGAMLNFFIGIQAKIFVGTEVSSYSHDLLATRFFRGYKENYKYLPDGLHEWTPSHVEDPPGFHC